MITVAVVAASGASGAVIDLWTRRVPNSLTLAIAGIGVTLAATGLSAVTLRMSLIGFALGFVLMLPGHIAGGTGAGDVKLFAGIGTLLGPAGILTAFLYTAVAGGLLAVIVAVRRRRLAATVERAAALVTTAGANVGEIEHPSSDNRFAYAPAIAIGAIAAALRF